MILQSFRTNKNLVPWTILCGNEYDLSSAWWTATTHPNQVQSAANNLQKRLTTQKPGLGPIKGRQWASTSLCLSKSLLDSCEGGPGESGDKAHHCEHSCFHTIPYNYPMKPRTQLDRLDRGARHLRKNHASGQIWSDLVTFHHVIIMQYIAIASPVSSHHPHGAHDAPPPLAGPSRLAA